MPIKPRRRTECSVIASGCSLARCGCALLGQHRQAEQGLPSNSDIFLRKKWEFLKIGVPYLETPKSFFCWPQPTWKKFSLGRESQTLKAFGEKSVRAVVLDNSEQLHGCCSETKIPEMSLGLVLRCGGCCHVS